MCLLSWIWLATMVLSSSWVFMGSSVFGCFPSSAIVLGDSDFLWLKLSYRSKIGLWCCSSKVSSMLEDFSIVMGVMGLELELLAWVSALGSLCSFPSDLDQILPSCFISPSFPLSRTGSLRSIKTRSPSASNNPTKQTHTTCNAILTGTDLRVGSKPLHCRVGLLFRCFP